MFLINAEGRYDKRAIMELAHANYEAARRDGFDPCFSADLSKAWNRAKAQRTQRAVDTGRTMPLTPLEARELATDGRL